MDKKELEDIASEYVLGTLSNEERLAAKARLGSDPEFAQLVQAWEERLAPLSLEAQDQIAPLGAWHKIADQLDRHPQELPASNESTIANLHKSRNRWRAAFVGAMALAASFIGLQAAGIYLPYLPAPKAEGRFIAVLNPSGTSTGFVIRVDVGTKRLEVQRLASKAPTGKDYELWVIEPKQAAKSLNIVGRDSVQQVSYSNATTSQPNKDGGITFAISLEPEGGSPTHKPTGPIVFSGKLITQ